MLQLCYITVFWFHKMFTYSFMYFLVVVTCADTHEATLCIATTSRIATL